MSDPSAHLFWITSRAAGITALLLASVSVGVGLLMGSKLLKRFGPNRRSVHEALSLATIAAIVVHGLSLIGDRYLHPSLLDVTVPFALSYKTLPTSLGIVAGWGLVVLGLSYYARAWIGQRRWRSIHRFAAVAWLAGLGHALLEGTDAGRLWFAALVALAAGPPLALLIARSTRRLVTARAPATV